MPVNQTFANYSDLAFKAAFAIYIVALVMSLVYYVKQQMLIDARRESKVLVGAGGGEITGASEPQDMFEARADAADKFGGMAPRVVGHYYSWHIGGAARVVSRKIPVGQPL